MKICLLASATSIHTVKWVNALVSLNHEVSLLTLHKTDKNKIDKRVNVHYLKFSNKFGYYMNIFEAKNILKKINPDILNVHYASGYGTLGRLLNFEPTLLSVWGSDVYIYPYQSKHNRKTLIKNLLSADQIASTSHAMKKQTELFIKPTYPIVTTPFGVDLNIFYPNKSANRDLFIIGTIKRLEKVSGIDILIIAVAELINNLVNSKKNELAKKVRLEIVGEGTEMEKLKKLTKEHGISDITNFIGAVPNDEVPLYLNKFDVYCALSRSESFGVASVEASACEVAVVVSNVGGLPEVVLDGETGFVVDYSNIDEIKNRLYELLLNQKKREEMGKKGRQFVSNHYDWEKNVSQMIGVYEKLLNRNL